MREYWEEEQLGKLFFTTSGGTPSRKNASYYTGAIPWVKSGELDKGLILDTEEKITEEAISNSSAKKFPPETLLIALYGATIGKLAFLGVEAATNQAICGIFKNQYCESKYLYNFLLFKRPRLISQGTGGAQPNISQTILKKLNVPICSIPEQRAIVAKIEELFSDLDKGIADLKKAQDQLKVYRQAVLKKAFEGDWKNTSVGNLFDFVGGGTPSKSEKDYWNGNIPWASVKDIKGDYLEKTQDFITEKGLENSSANLALKDEVTLITRISPGKSLVTTIDTAINQDLKIVKPKTRMFNKYIHYLFKSIERICIKLSSGTTVKGINLTNLKSIEIPVIEEEVQHQIVQEIESRLSVCDKVEQSITESLEKARALRQSILKKAFEGTLLSIEEIAACKAAPDYEPASVLLEKIKEEKSSANVSASKGKKKK